MKLPRMLWVLIRWIGVLGLGIGLFATFIGLISPILTKAQRVDVPVFGFGLAASAVSLFCFYVARNRTTAAEKKGSHDA